MHQQLRKREQLIRKVSTLPVIVSLVVLVSLYPRFGDWLGEWLPVTSKATNIITEPVPDGGKGSGGWTHVQFDVEKYRDCEWLALRIYWIDADGFLVRIPWKNPDENARGTEQSRPAGLNRVRLLVGSTLPPGKWRMDAYHSCHPWLPNFRTQLLP